MNETVTQFYLIMLRQLSAIKTVLIKQMAWALSSCKTKKQTLQSQQVEDISFWLNIASKLLDWSRHEIK